jgi:hypothetical protein
MLLDASGPLEREKNMRFSVLIGFACCGTALVLSLMTLSAQAPGPMSDEDYVKAMAKKVNDAAGFAKSAVAAADATATASQKMDMATLGESQKTLAAACQSCHMAHRERLPDGTFKIK